MSRLMGDRPIEIDKTPVPVLAEPLHPIWWRGRQWAVTECGIEALDGKYYIEAARLREDIDSHGWPSHLAEKNWVDLPEFMTAWLVALALHGADGEVVREAIRSTRIYTAPESG